MRAFAWVIWRSIVRRNSASRRRFSCSARRLASAACRAAWRAFWAFARSLHADDVLHRVELLLRLHELVVQEEAASPLETVDRVDAGDLALPLLLLGPLVRPLRGDAQGIPEAPERQQKVLFDLRIAGLQGIRLLELLLGFFELEGPVELQALLQVVVRHHAVHLPLHALLLRFLVPELEGLVLEVAGHVGRARRLDGDVGRVVGRLLLGLLVLGSIRGIGGGRGRGDRFAGFGRLRRRVHPVGHRGGCVLLRRGRMDVFDEDAGVVPVGRRQRVHQRARRQQQERQGQGNRQCGGATCVVHSDSTSQDRARIRFRAWCERCVS
jgi:hypothetical protein